jgi:anti-sigma regulatory factor (Ser/Thr protein kinase)
VSGPEGHVTTPSRQVVPRILTDEPFGSCEGIARGQNNQVSEKTADPEVKVDLPPDLTAAREARAATRRVLPRWRLGAVLEPVLLVVSELVGNAVRHGRPPVDLRLRKAGRGVRVDVHDEEPTPPIPSTADADAESGRGLVLIDAVASESGVEFIEGDGKVVWARVDPESDDD